MSGLRIADFGLRGLMSDALRGASTELRTGGGTQGVALGWRRAALSGQGRAAHERVCAAETVFFGAAPVCAEGGAAVLAFYPPRGVLRAGAVCGDESLAFAEMNMGEGKNVFIWGGR